MVGSVLGLAAAAQWSHDRAASPCAEPVSTIVADLNGRERPMCFGHVADASKNLLGATVRPLPDTDGGQR
jgi:hypothetical protein